MATIVARCGNCNTSYKVPESMVGQKGRCKKCRQVFVIEPEPPSYTEAVGLKGGECVRTFEGHTDEVNSVCMSANGKWALSGSGLIEAQNDNTARLWDAATGECLHTFEGHTDRVMSVCLDEDAAGRA